MPLFRVPPLPEDYVDRLAVQYVSATEVKIGPGLCRAVGQEVSINVTADLTADITVAGAGGLDAGAEAADTWYAVYVIADFSGVTPNAAILSTSFVAPVLPAGFTSYRRVGAVRNDSASDFIDFIQDQGHGTRWTRYRTALSSRVVLANGTATADTAIDCSEFVPPTSRVASFVVEEIGTQQAQLADNGVPSTTPIITVTSPGDLVAQMRVDGGQQLYYAHSAGGGDLSIAVAGYLESYVTPSMAGGYLVLP